MQQLLSDTLSIGTRKTTALQSDVNTVMGTNFVRKRFWSESALRKLSERGISMLTRVSSESEVAQFLRASVTRDLVPDDDDR